MGVDGAGDVESFPDFPGSNGGQTYGSRGHRVRHCNHRSTSIMASGDYYDVIIKVWQCNYVICVLVMSQDYGNW